MSKKIIIGLVSFGLAAVSTVNAQNVNYGVTDIQLRASSSATPPSGPNGYTRVGYWDVDGGGSKGTNGSTGHYMMALYLKKGNLTGASTCVTDVQLRASSSSTPPNGPAGYKQIGYWDVDGGGSHGTNGSTGHYMMAMYANTAKIGSGTKNCVTDVQLTASNTGTPRPGPNGYKPIGDWDVGAGGSKGTDGSTGHWKMTTYMKSAAVYVENCNTKNISQAYTRTGTGESLVAPFTSPSTSTAKSYSGLVEVIVSGTGYSYGMTVNDAFFGVKTGKPLDPQYYQLNIGWNGAPLKPYAGEPRNIANFIKFVDGIGKANLPTYNSNNRYHFVIEVPKDAGKLSFGVSDGGFDENAGQYNIAIYSVKETKADSCKNNEIQSTPPLKCANAVFLKNQETKRYAFSTGKPVNNKEGGWLKSPNIVGADANYYNRARWCMTTYRNIYQFQNKETKRYLFSTGSKHTGSDGNEGGWLKSPTIVGADANYYNRAQWTLIKRGDAYMLKNLKTNRYLFSTGKKHTGADGNEGGWLKSPELVGADANYYNRALWYIVK